MRIALRTDSTGTSCVGDDVDLNLATDGELK